MMQKPHVLTSVTLPRQRLGVTENALPVSLIVGCLIFLLFGVLAGAVGWLLTHAFMVVVCHLEPYIIYLVRARRVPRTSRQLQAGGNIYGA